ncbi:hypothetical protein CEXT_491331 [Caerostris extrusa]|uniref:Uncharacterized protein n=1 Tax=Caerostris extrusa TaxID=172846 RepID=A0AAV4SXD3_CAEEX|nr:hypothetical protein CEXT_491331 [Caerostris extrusa]
MSSRPWKQWPIIVPLPNLVSLGESAEHLKKLCPHPLEEGYILETKDEELHGVGFVRLVNGFSSEELTTVLFVIQYRLSVKSSTPKRQIQENEVHHSVWLSRGRGRTENHPAVRSESKTKMFPSRLNREEHSSSRNTLALKTYFAKGRRRICAGK